MATRGNHQTHSGNRREESTEQSVLVPRDSFHLETVYGERFVDRGSTVKVNKRLTPEIADRIINKKERAAIMERLHRFDNDPEAAFKNVKKDPIYLNEARLDEVSVYDRIFVYRQALNDQFKKTDAIVDPEIRKIVENHLAANNNDPKKAFGDLKNNPVWYNKEKGLQIKAVNVQQKADELHPVRVKANGQPKDFVFTRNNHHIAFFKDESGKIYDEVITFWDAFERKKQGLSEFPETSSKGDPKTLSPQVINDLVPLT